VDGPDISALAGHTVADVLAPLGLVADALRYLHGKRIVHRDIKASNVLIDSNGAPYLTDFGVSCPVGEIGQGGSLVAQSPQSLDGAPATTADDIFAFGALLYELLAGRSPWPSSDTEDAIRKAAPAPLGNAGIPAEVSHLVGEMLSVDPAARPDAEAVAERLRTAGFAPGVAPLRTAGTRAVADEAIETVQSIRPTSRSDREATIVPPAESTGINSKVVYGSLAALLVLLVGVVFFLPDTVNERNEKERVTIDLEPEVEPPPSSADAGRDASGIYIDPEVQQRLRSGDNLPVRTLEGDEEITFSENMADYSGLDDAGRTRFNAEAALGELLAAFEVLEGRGIERWAPVEHAKARSMYAEGDKAYLEKQFAAAEMQYLGALSVLEPTYDRIEPTFREAYQGGQAAFDAGDRLEALRLFELAVAVTPTHAGALEGLRRAQNLEEVLRLVDQGGDYERDMDYVAALQSYERALALDEQWQAAHEGVARVRKAQTKLEFDLRMSEGFEALMAGDYYAARAAFRVAQRLIPESSEPADGLMQVDQGLRLDAIGTLEREARSLEADEHWDAVITTYEEILKVDNTLTFAADGLRHAREMSALHKRLEDYVSEPDKLSSPSVMQQATQFVVEITTRSDVGPRLAAQRDELSRLLRRAATPLPVALVSDNVTDVAVYKVGRLGTFMRREISLRPGTYVAVGSRPGFRDVRLEFRVAPEIDIEPVIIQCEEPI
ncbi:MAG: protein kinase, partial [Pseudomonadota bacterium]